jgi:hypothetical protein
MTIHVNAEQAKSDIKEKLDLWMSQCSKLGKSGHETNHPATNVKGVGYTGSTENDPATILETDWAIVIQWWNKLNLDAQYNKWNCASMTVKPDGQDLCCSCDICAKIEKPNFGSVTGKSLKLRTFVYHLKTIKTAPILPPVLVTEITSPFDMPDIFAGIRNSIQEGTF